jgi:hypothetical protein
MKTIKEHTPIEDAKILDEARTYLRANAPQVKTIMRDNAFTGSITVTERIDKGAEGYEVISNTFEDLDALKDYYGKPTIKKSVKKSTGNIRKSAKRNSGTIKKILAKFKSKKR